MKPEQLTAWALNEASPDERAQVEASLAEDPALRDQADSLKQFCATLERNLGSPDAGGLTAAQKVALQHSAAPPAVAKRPVIVAGAAAPRPHMIRIAALAACLMLGAVWLTRWGVKSMQQPSEEVTVALGGKPADEEQDKRTEAPVFPPLKDAKPSYESTAVSIPLPPPPLPEMPASAPQPLIAFRSESLPSTASAPSAESVAVIANREIDPRRNSAARPTVKADTYGNAPALAQTQVAEPSRPLGDESDLLGVGAERARRAWNNEGSGERYQPLVENAFAEVSQAPLSTFSIDVDTAAYANVRRFLNQGVLPPADAVRLEEMINYFPYDYEQPDGAHPFSVQVDVAEAPWKPTHRLARIAIRGREIERDRLPSNLVFLVDVSGSMGEPNKLPLVKQSLHLLAEQLQDRDRVAIVTYASSSGVALESTADKTTLRAGIDALRPGGSTHGASGIQLAYEQAQKHFIKEGVNRVLLCTDGDFNVGISSPHELEKLIKEKARSGVFLSVLGYGTGNLQDYTMETLADKGNGNYAYIDSLGEARKVLVEQMHGTLVTIAKDVKIQVEFNPAQVASYRLIGYENRLLAKEDFNNDQKDAGEIGAGHTVTAFYEIVPVSVRQPDGRPLVDGLKYQRPAAPPVLATSDEMLTVKLRYKLPEAHTSQLIEVPLNDSASRLADAPKEFQFATAVVGFGMLLRQSAAAGELGWEEVRKLALQSKGADPLGYRGEFIQLIEKARGLAAQR
jgi:secreted protein with Ig-like and vWFA domain